MTKERFKELMKPITDGLFGKQKPYSPKMQRYAVRPVGVIVADLCAIEEPAWGKYAFSREPLNGKFNDDQRRELTAQAIRCGAQYAERYAVQYGTRDPEALAKQLGVKIDYPLMPQSTDRVLFAEFREPDTIHVYMDGVRKAEFLFEEPGVREALGGVQISKLLLAHELFHLVEEKNKREIWTKTYRVELWAPKPLHNRSRVNVLGEIAAMSFAKTLTGLSYSPYVMDAFLVYGYAPEAASALYEEMMGYAGLVPKGGTEPLPANG